ncbi:MAG: Rv3654c family TadE-like protein [Nocardioides sp.]|uniref:Rv3654c family TadE-like protein n=1 Tax=Nocardioides sp. TaxID=35761 RepID=UPI003F0F0D2D
MRAGRTRERSSDERGAATVLVVALAGLLCFVAVALAGAGGLVLAQREAQAAADLAALAGAVAANGTAGGDPCGQAHRVAVRNGARLTRCTEKAGTVDVDVEVDVRGPMRPLGAVPAAARAGPR